MTNYNVSSFCMFMQNPRETTEQLHELWGTYNTPSPHASASSSAPTAYRDFFAIRGHIIIEHLDKLRVAIPAGLHLGSCIKSLAIHPRQDALVRVAALAQGTLKP